MDRRARERGFTLIEMLVVLMILMLLTGIVTVNVLRHQSRARRDAATIQIRQLQSALRTYQLEQGRIPTMEQGLEALVRKPDRAPVPENYPADGYLDSRRMPKDPWSRDFAYAVPGRDGAAFEVLSYGADGEPGGAGDAADVSSADL